MSALLTSVSTVVVAADSQIDYERVVKPILRGRCYACHGALKQESGLRLDTAGLIRTGGDSGPAVVAGEVDQSPLVERITAAEGEGRMPPEGHPLEPDQIAAIQRWIEQGASGPADEEPERHPRDHWAFRAPVRPTMPDFSTGIAAGNNPVDAFMHARRQAAGVVPLPPADKATLLRRVYLDLVGVPPGADELNEFQSDDSPTAFEDVVDRLLASPMYGERWGRHWMDVWRYSDWYGRRAVPDVMNSYPMIWRWRDWIVRSLNDDKGYDRMLLEMLAADELMPEDDQNIVATGYLVRSWFKWNYETWKKDLVEHTGKAFLGLTMNCCQCHDHKYDPLSQEEYFRFRAFFEPLELRHDRVPGEPDPGPFEKYIYGKPYGPIRSGLVRVFDEQLDAPTYMFVKGDSRLRMEGKPPVTAASPAVLGGDKRMPAPIMLPIAVAYPGMKPALQAEELAKRNAALTAAELEWDNAQARRQSLPALVKDELEAAQVALESARRDATAQSSTAMVALEGSQSLELNAVTGRRTLSHELPGLEPLAADGTVSYLVQIRQDGHTNLQLALDVVRGATGGFIAFENGAIKTYAPGGFQEFVAGRYDLGKGQDQFRVLLQLDLPASRLLLTVTSQADNQLLVDSVPAALNGWSPAENGKRGLFLDCRPGTVAIYDDLRFTQPNGNDLLAFRFEAPEHLDGSDLVNINGWKGSSFSEPGGTSTIVSAVTGDPRVQAAVARLAAAQRAARLPELTLAAAEARLAAARHELASLQQRIEADATRYSTGQLSEDRKSEPAVLERIHAAWRTERQAAVATAEASLHAGDLAVATAEAQAAAAAKSGDKAAADVAAKSLLAAQQQQAAARTAHTAARASLAEAPGEYTPLSPKYLQRSTGRRAALAQWIAHRDNPLTARVAVNHIWLRHFGQALVETPHDFGRNGSPPTHPELLDWLAIELMDTDWSMRPIHRLIVLSAAYRLASGLPVSSGPPSDAMLTAERLDPDNRTYWRAPLARMQAEVVRDSLLAVAGELDETMGGHELDHKLGLTSRRRSIYFAHHGEEKMEFLELFDAPSALECYQRTSSVQPQQALALTNSELTKSLSRELTRRLETRAAGGGLDGSDGSAGFVRLVFQQILSRQPRAVELSAAVRFLEQQTQRLAAPGGLPEGVEPAARARENLVHALMNHNDFVTIR